MEENKIVLDENSEETIISTSENQITESETKETENDSKRKIHQSIYDWIEAVCISVAVVVVIFTFFGRLSTVNGTSMNNTLSHNDKVIVWHLGYVPERYDIVACQKEEGFTEAIVKRVIAFGGETVHFDFQAWKVWVITKDGDRIDIDDSFVNRVSGPMDRQSVLYSTNAVEVPEGCIFVMGDNRNSSTDSRSNIIGCIKEDEIIGKVIFRIFPNTGVLK